MTTSLGDLVKSFEQAVSIHSSLLKDQAKYYSTLLLNERIIWQSQYVTHDSHMLYSLAVDENSNNSLGDVVEREALYWDLRERAWKLQDRLFTTQYLLPLVERMSRELKRMKERDFRLKRSNHNAYEKMIDFTEMIKNKVTALLENAKQLFDKVLEVPSIDHALLDNDDTERILRTLDTIVDSWIDLLVRMRTIREPAQ